MYVCDHGQKQHAYIPAHAHPQPYLGCLWGNLLEQPRLAKGRPPARIVGVLVRASEHIAVLALLWRIAVSDLPNA